jgi:hypothetical protein
MKRCAIGLCVLVMMALSACGGDDVTPAVDAGADAGPTDAGAPDAGNGDAGLPDGGNVDAGDVDAAVCPVDDSSCRVTAISARGEATCALRGTGAVVCWGAAILGDSLTPTPVSGLTDAVEISTGGGHTCARQTGGTVVCWGANNTGQIGDGTTTDRPTPTPVSGLTDALEISAGTGHFTCARRSTSPAVICWGFNQYGQLGDGTAINWRLTPAAVAGVGAAVELSAGQFHACARLSDGTVACWGSNDSGQLGDGVASHSRCIGTGGVGGDVDCSLTPVPVSGLTDAVEISAGFNDTCARRSSGAVVCWGDGVPTPTPVPGLTDAVEISGGNCARRSSGDIVCWSGTPALPPTPVSGLTDVTEISSSGGDHACALRGASGEVLCWGLNRRGQLGDGTTTDSLVPVRVVGL